MRMLCALIGGMIIVGLFTIGLGVRDYSGPFFDPKCVGADCAVTPQPGPHPIRPIPAASP